MNEDAHDEADFLASSQLRAVPNVFRQDQLLPRDLEDWPEDIFAVGRQPRSEQDDGETPPS